MVVYGSGEQSWKEPLTLGSGNAVLCGRQLLYAKNVGHKTMAHHIASNNGSRYVFRYKIIEDVYIASKSIYANGNKYGWKRGSRSYEIYGNKIKAIHRWAGINIRGGDGVIFDNEIEGEFISPLHLMHEGRQGDGNCDYPCPDQIRRIHIWGNTYNRQKIPQDPSSTAYSVRPGNNSGYFTGLQALPVPSSAGKVELMASTV